MITCHKNLTLSQLPESDSNCQYQWYETVASDIIHPWHAKMFFSTTKYIFTFYKILYNWNETGLENWTSRRVREYLNNSFALWDVAVILKG